MTTGASAVTGASKSGSGIQLGRLQRVTNLRDVWENEAQNFTPWLAEEENLELLGETIGVALELDSVEKEVGPFRADVLCREAGRDRWVLVENQLERTDHSHLGQLLTYAAGLQAAVIVWIARELRSEHRAALDWLNEITSAEFAFFGLEIELWRIGGSALAPKFNIVCQPNEWARSADRGKKTDASGTDGPGGTKELQLAYWTALREYLADAQSPVSLGKPQPASWMSMSFGRSAFYLVVSASTWHPEKKTYDVGELRAEVVLDRDEAKAYFKLLHEQREELEKHVGKTLVWYDPPNAKICRISLKCDADIRNRAAWPEQHEWFRDSLERLDRVFRPVIKNLPAAADLPPSEE